MPIPKGLEFLKKFLVQAGSGEKRGVLDKKEIWRNFYYAKKKGGTKTKMVSNERKTYDDDSHPKKINIFWKHDLKIRQNVVL